MTGPTDSPHSPCVCERERDAQWLHGLHEFLFTHEGYRPVSMQMCMCWIKYMCVSVHREQGTIWIMMPSRIFLNSGLQILPTERNSNNSQCVLLLRIVSFALDVTAELIWTLLTLKLFCSVTLLVRKHGL